MGRTRVAEADGRSEPAVSAAVGIRHAVAAERERGQRVRAFPRRAEPNGPVAAAVDAQRFGAVLESAVADAAQDDVAAAAKHGEVDEPVAVDVERIRAGDIRQVCHRRRRAGELERASHQAFVSVERRRLAPSSEEQLVAAVVIAVERGHAASDEELRPPGVGVVDAGGDRLVHEVAAIRARAFPRSHRCLAPRTRRPLPRRPPTLRSRRATVEFERRARRD